MHNSFDRDKVGNTLSLKIKYVHLAHHVLIGDVFDDNSRLFKSYHVRISIRQIYGATIMFYQMTLYQSRDFSDHHMGGCAKGWLYSTILILIV